MKMTLEEAKTIAVLGERAPLGHVHEALDVLFVEVRKLETEHTSIAIADKRTAEAVEEVLGELADATLKFGPLASPHEGLGVILEEFEELKDWVKLREEKRVAAHGRAEAKQLAAVSIRFMLDCAIEREEVASS